MIAFIKGIVIAFGLDYLILENNGMGYRIAFTQQGRISLGQEVTIYTHMNVREDEISLFGFISQLDLNIFQQLINVKGLGPKTAINMLGTNNGERILKAIEDEDVAFLKSLPGIGAKTASQMVLDLKGKLAAKIDGSSRSSSGNVNEAIDALKDLGFKNAELGWIEKELIKEKDKPVNELIKLGLQLLQIRKGGL